jgi:hypothetical protein
MILKIIFVFVLLNIISSSFCLKDNEIQIQNINPTPNEQPWLVGGFSESEDNPMMSQAEINSILSRINTRNLRDNADHSFSEYMRPVFSQDGGSCGSASRICYMFAYEINNYRNVSGSLPENIYPSHFTWLLTGQNSGKEQMAIANGIPNSVDYGGDTYSDIYGGNIYWPEEGESDYGWMNGFELWYNAMQNRLQNNLFISLNNPDNLLILKSWMNDHHEDDDFSEGGVAGAGCAITGAVYAQIPTGEYEQGKHIVREWGPQVDHGTTWSGYDDNVGFDFNEDGQITNDIDINGDNIVDMEDWERGALIMLNSWGSGWKNSGTVYVPYRLLKINNMGAEFYYIKKDYSPEHVLKINMEFDMRRRVKLSVGISSDINAVEPEVMIPCHHFNYAGLKDVAMLGVWADNTEHTEPMELAYDLTDLFFGINTTLPYRYFLVLETSGNGGYGMVNNASVLHIQDTSTAEYPAETEDVEITDGEPIYIPVDMPGDPDSNPYIAVPQSEMSVYYYDSAQGGTDSLPENSIDGNPETIWHTVWGDGDPCPHEIQYDLGSSYDIGALSYLPRQVGSNGRIKDYELFISQTPDDFLFPIATGTWPDTSAEQIIFFPPTEGRYVRLVALNEVNGGPWTSIAEIRVFQPPVVETGNEEIPTSSISQAKIISAYPNPFNPSTTITFIADSTKHLEIAVYNLKGQKVKQLISKSAGQLSTGEYSVIWNGRTDAGRDVASGVYFIRINSGDFEQTKKAVMIK